MFQKVGRIGRGCGVHGEKEGSVQE